MSNQPPHLADWLLTKLLGDRDAAIIKGDLNETFSRRKRGCVWYWTQVASCILVRWSPGRLIPDLHRDLHYAFRIVQRNPGYAMTAMVCLALGIGVNTTVFSWLDEMYFRRLAVPDPKQIVSIDRAGAPAFSWRDYRSFRGELETLSGLAAIIPKGTFLDVGSANDQIYTEVVSANYFGVLGVRPALGRSFSPSEDEATSEPVTVISHAVWSRHFQRDPEVLGRSVRIENQWYRIVGVAPPSFRGASAPLAVDAWVPLATYPHYRQQVAQSSSEAGPDVFLVGRLAESQTVSRTLSELRVVDSRISELASDDSRRKNGVSIQSVAGYGWARAQRGLRPLAILLGTVVCVVLLIACVNVANLLLSRAAVRQREMAVRRALGAGHIQLIRQGVTEGLVLAVGGAALGVLLGSWMNQLLALLLPSSNPDLAQYTFYLDLNWRVAGFTAAVSVFCALVFSVSPALENARGDVTPALKGGLGGSTRSRGRGGHQRDVLVVLQVALSLALLVCAGLLIRALQEAQGTDPGFAAHNRIYVRLFAPEEDFTPQQATSLFERLLDEARAIPGAREVTLSFAVFGFMDSDCAAASKDDEPRKLNINVVEPNYFQFMDVPILRGRSFVSADRPNSPRVIVVNETMARQWWPGEDPIGKTAWLGCEKGSSLPAEVVGMVRDSKYGTLDEQPRPFYFAHWRQVWWNGFFALMLHTAEDPRGYAEPLLKLAQTGGPNLRVYELRSFEDLLALSLHRARWNATLLVVFSLLAITLATVGLYGLVAYVAAQKTREVGVRMALGAQRADVGWMVLRKGLKLTVIGVLLGLVLSAGVTQLLRGFLFGVSPLDPLAFAASAGAWILISSVASYIPARRATRINPVSALRHE